VWLKLKRYNWEHSKCESELKFDTNVIITNGWITKIGTHMFGYIAEYCCGTTNPTQQ